jgi:hypothetical protein
VQAKRGCHRGQQGIHLGQTRQIKKGNQSIIRATSVVDPEQHGSALILWSADTVPDPGEKNYQQEKKKGKKIIVFQS